MISIPGPRFWLVCVRPSQEERPKNFKSLDNSRMSRRYDSRTTTFSPEGRLYQVEYALEAINNASSTLGILAKDGVVLAADKMVTSKLLDHGRAKEKLYKVRRSYDPEKACFYPSCGAVSAYSNTSFLA